MDPYAWSWNLEALLVVPLLVLAYVVALQRHPAPWWRIACFAVAMALVLAVSITPIETIALQFLLSIHLLQNVVLAEWAPLLLVLAIPPALAEALTRSQAARVLTHPAVALPLWLGNYMLWHLPWLYDTALENRHTLLHLEHALYFATGVLMWWSILQDAPHRLGAGARAGLVFAAFVLASPIGLVIALVPEAIYDFYVDVPERLWGLSALTDQQLGGIFMSVEQALGFFVVFAYWFVRFFAEEERRQEDEDRHEAEYPASTRP